MPNELVEASRGPPLQISGWRRSRPPSAWASLCAAAVGVPVRGLRQPRRRARAPAKGCSNQVDLEVGGSRETAMRAESARTHNAPRNGRRWRPCSARRAPSTAASAGEAGRDSARAHHAPRNRGCTIAGHAFARARCRPWSAQAGADSGRLRADRDSACRAPSAVGCGPVRGRPRQGRGARGEWGSICSIMLRQETSKWGSIRGATKRMNLTAEPVACLGRSTRREGPTVTSASRRGAGRGSAPGHAPASVSPDCIVAPDSERAQYFEWRHRRRSSPASAKGRALPQA
jgi:hypothetical protein